MFYFEHEELEDGEWIYCVYRRGRTGEIARCEHVADAEKIVDAMNAAYMAPAVGVFG